MKIFWAGVLMLIVTASAGLAQTVYINDIVKVALRSGPSYDHKILTVLSSGDTLEVIERGEQWSLVRGPSGPSGWLATRLLSDQEPNILKIRRLEQQLTSWQADEAPAEAELKAENALAEARFELEAVRQAYTALKNESLDNTHDRRALDDTKARIKELEGLLAACRDRADQEIWSAALRWFLTGAGVLLLGVLLGFHARRRRSGLL